MKFEELPIGDPLYVAGQWAIVENGSQVGVISHVRECHLDSTWKWRVVFFKGSTRVTTFKTWEEAEFFLALRSFE